MDCRVEILRHELEIIFEVLRAESVLQDLRSKVLAQVVLYPEESSR